MKKILMSAVLVVSVCFLINSCSEKPVPSVTETGVVLNKNELFLRIGQSDTLLALVYPQFAENKNVVWSSDNTSVAIVDILTGKVTAVSEGTAKVSAAMEDGGYADTCVVTVRPPVSIYAVGGNSYNAVLWKDGELSVLGDESMTTANAVALDGEDVYVVGQVWGGNGWEACVWKNGVSSALSYSGFPTYPNDVFVSQDGSVLVCGYSVTENPRATVPVLWKDGVAQLLPSESSLSEAGAVAEYEGKVYAAGYDYNTDYEVGHYAHGILWTDGQRTELTDGSDKITCTDIEFGPDGKMYMSGYRTDHSGAAVTPFICVDGVFTELTHSVNTYATSVAVYGEDVYVSGYADVSMRDENNDPIPRYIVLYWKNGEKYELTDGTTNAGAATVEVRDGDVYIGGYDSEVSTTPYTRTYARIWKNGEVVFTDDSANCWITDMALTE